MTSFLIGINEFRWAFLDKLYQKASNLSGPLGVLSEYVHLAPPCLVYAYLFPFNFNPLVRLTYLISSTVLILFLNRVDDLSKKNWVKKQIKQICLKSKTEVKVRKLVYIASSYSESTGLFPGFFFDFRTKSDITRLAKNFDITFIEAKDENQLQKKISKLNDRDIDAVIIQAHGNRSRIQFSKKYFADLDSLGIFELIKNKLKPNAILSLIACSTGYGIENIARKISVLCSDSTVFSPNADYLISDCDSFKIYDNGSCSFKTGNFITGLWSKRIGSTKIYQNGQTVETTLL